MWHSTNPMPGQKGLVLLPSSDNVIVSNRLLAGNSYILTQDAQSLTVPLQSVGAIHSFWLLPRLSEVVFSLGSRYSLRALSRPASSRSISTARSSEWLFELRDNGTVLQSAACSSMGFSASFDDAVYGAFTGLSLCVGYAMQSSGQGVMYFHAASHKIPTFHGGIASFGATTCSLRANINIADALEGPSTISAPTTGYINSFVPGSAVLHAIARSGPFYLLATNSPDALAEKEIRKGLYPGSMRSNALHFREFTDVQLPLLADSAGHCEVALQPGFSCASNALPMRDVAFMPPDVGWRSNVSPDFTENQRLARLRVEVDAHEISTGFFQTRFDYWAPVAESTCATGQNGNNEYVGSAADTLRVIRKSDNQEITSRSNVVLAAELSLTEKMTGATLAAASLQNKARLIIDFRDAFSFGWELTAIEFASLLAGDTVSLLLPPAETSKPDGSPAYARITAVGP